MADEISDTEGKAMYTAEFDNVNDAFNKLCRLMAQRGVLSDSRNGKVLALDAPFVMRLNHPNRRVLFDEQRNCNPIFHLMESLWMLAGRNDVAFVSQFNSNMESFSDDGKTFNGAYGYRWRRHFGYDQLTRAVEMLKANPLDRRVVISMWDPHDDLGAETLDVPCNQQMMPRVVTGRLHLTTTNRSNDMVWGLMGANCVHLTVLQEWMAAALGLHLGRWYHMTNNLHVYERHFDLVRKMQFDLELTYMPWEDYKMVLDPWVFMAECEALCAGKEDGFSEPFFDGTVAPMLQSWREWKEGLHKDAIETARCIEAWDWASATVKWYLRALNKRR